MERVEGEWKNVKVFRGQQKLKVVSNRACPEPCRLLSCLVAAGAAALSAYAFTLTLYFTIYAPVLLGCILAAPWVIGMVVSTYVLYFLRESWLVPVLEIVGDSFRLRTVFVFSCPPGGNIHEGGRGWRRLTQPPMLVQKSWWFGSPLRAHTIKLSDGEQSCLFKGRMHRCEGEWLLREINAIIPQELGALAHLL